MSTRRCAVVLGLLLLAVAARAEEHDKELHAAALYSPQSTLWGGHFSTAWVLPKPQPGPKELPWSWVLDLSVQAGGHDGTNRTQFVGLLGFRHTWGFEVHYADDHARKYHRYSVFTQVLTGVVHTRDDGQGRTGPAVGGSVGLEYLYSKWGGLRLQGDFIGAKNSTPVPRISLGVVYRFEHH